MTGLGHAFSLALPGARGAGAAVVYDFYADSAAGNDAAAGTQAAPVQTLAKLKTLMSAKGAGARGGLKRGSMWREALDMTALTAPVVGAYGASGNPPLITGANVVTAWTKVGGTTNVYSASVTHDANGDNRLRVYENDVLLVRVADQTTCDSTAGSFVIAVGGDGSPLTMKIHTSDGSNPASNGKTYEVTVRTVGIGGPDNCSVSGIETARAISNNGSADLVSRVNGLLSCVIGTDGSKHNVGIGSGTMQDCIAYRADAVTAVEPSNGQLVGFLNDGAGQTVAFKRCGVIGPAPGADVIVHGSVHTFDSATAEQLWVSGTGQFTTALDTNKGSFYDGVCTFPADNGTVQMVMAKVIDNNVPKSPGNYAATTLTDCVLLKAQSVSYNEAWRPVGAYQGTFNQCSFYANVSLTTGYPVIWFNNMGSSARFTMTKCVIFNGTNLMQLASGATYVGDYNVFLDGEPGTTRPVTFLHYSAGYCLTLAAWQTASGQDAHSVYLARADQSSGNAHAFWLGVSTGTNNGPVDGDWRINPSARVYDGSDVAHTGTFPDGTPITSAGAQNHWDWNARASATGAPTRWPVVPASLADARSYVNAPEKWNFYP